MNIDIKQQAIELRHSGVSLKQISEKLGVAKGTVQGWVKFVVLSPEQKSRLLSRPNAYHPPKKDRGAESRLARMCTKPLTKENKAQIAEAAVMLRLTLVGLDVYGSVFDGSKADWLVRTPSGESAVIQVKWAREQKHHGLPTVNLTCAEGHSKRRRYSTGEFDFIVGYDLRTDTAYVFSESDVKNHRAAITIDEAYAERWDKLLKF